MAADRIIENRTCRWYAAGYVWVSEDGVAAYRSDKGTPKRLWVDKADPKTGLKVIKKGKEKISMRLAVITCFCPPKPNDGKRYHIKHKDGELSNCSRYNLEWELDHYHHNPGKYFDFKLDGKKYRIKRDGTVWEGKTQVSVCDFLYDPDMDLHAILNPHIRTGHLSKHVHSLDDLMSAAGFVQGDDMVLQSPVILHKDNDWMNFDADNLEWCEASDPRYIAYQKQASEERHKRLLEMNQGRTIPDFWGC